MLLSFKSASILFLVLFYTFFLQAQRDSLKLNNNDILVGEVKELIAGVLTLETAYSDKDFKIEFNKVRELKIQRKCIIILTRNRRRFGHIKTTESGTVQITLEDGIIEDYRLSEIIGLQEIEDSFFKRLRGSIDLGYNITKAKNNSQFTIASKLSYKSQLWLLQGSVNVLNSSQDDSEDVKRTDANIETIRLIGKQWYFLADISFLSNTEQALESRISPSLGIGNFLISSNKMFLGATVGVIYNAENFTDSSLNRNSSEAYLGLSLNMYDFKDFSLYMDTRIIPSLSESSRLRSDFDLTLKYDLPLDFYIKLGFTYNYDNRPAVIGNEFDYIFTSGFGWDFND